MRRFGCFTEGQKRAGHGLRKGSLKLWRVRTIPRSAHVTCSCVVVFISSPRGDELPPKLRTLALPFPCAVGRENAPPQKPGSAKTCHTALSFSKTRQCTVSAPGRAPPMPKMQPPRAWRRRRAREHVSPHRMPGRTLFDSPGPAAFWGHLE